MYKVTVDKNSDGQRADKFIKKILPLAPNSFIYKMFRKKDVKVNGVRIKV
jgi:23S rRNA pseudouridine955/2504/2580 synthase